MKYLVLESVGAKPHLETAGEIALTLLDEGHEVVFVFLGRDLPWNDFDLPHWLKWVGCSLDKRVVPFEVMLAGRGVLVRSVPSLPDHVRKSCQRFAERFDSGLIELKQYRYRNVPLGLGCASSLISWYCNSEYDPAADRGTVRRALLTAALTYERAAALINTEKPDKVITFNGRFATCRPIVEAAASEGVPLLRHERGATNDKYGLFEESVHSYDYIRKRIEAIWQEADPIERERLAHALYQRRRGGDPLGWYSCIGMQERGKIKPWTPGKTRVLYFPSNDDEFAAVSDTVIPSHWGTQFEALKSLISVCGDIHHIELMIRLHPWTVQKWVMRNSWAETDRWRAFWGNNVITIPEDSDIDSYAQLESADLVVTYGSTIGIEAVYWGKPSILMGPAPYAGMGVCIEPKSIADLSQLLRHAKELAVPPQASCLPYGYYHVMHGTPYRFYKPDSMFEGTFLGERFSWYSFPIEALRQAGVVRGYRGIKRKVKEGLYTFFKSFR